MTSQQRASLGIRKVLAEGLAQSDNRAEHDCETGRAQRKHVSGRPQESWRTSVCVCVLEYRFDYRDAVGNCEAFSALLPLESNTGFSVLPCECMWSHA